MDMRIAIVTGASSGIGREFVNQIPGFYKHLDEIWVTARRGERLEEVKQEVEGRTGVYVRIFAGDLEKDLVYKQILNRLENQSPDIRMLVNAAGSRILNISSGASFCPQPGFTVYAATKAYVTSFSRGLYEEMKEEGIVVTAVCPGPVDTEFFDVSGTTHSKIKESVMVPACDVVRTALLDSRMKKPLSVHGALMKGARIAGKLVPEEILFSAMDKWMR